MDEEVDFYAAKVSGLSLLFVVFFFHVDVLLDWGRRMSSCRDCLLT